MSLLDEIITDLTGTWQCDKNSSESMEPILKLQGMSWFNRKAAGAFGIKQVFTFSDSEENYVNILIKNIVGPVTTIVEGLANSGFFGTFQMNGKVSEGKDSPKEVVVDIVECEYEECAEKMIQVKMLLGNDDRRIIHHVRHKTDPMTKKTFVKYITAGGEEATITQVFKKA